MVLKVINSLFPIEISRKTDKILFKREKSSRIGVLNYERSEYFKLAICDIFRVRNKFFLVFLQKSSQEWHFFHVFNFSSWTEK